MESELTGRDLDAAVAVEVMGAEPGKFPAQYSVLVVPSLIVEAEIERRGLVEKYLRILANNICGDSGASLSTVSDLWAIRRATPEQICRAALAACRGAK